MAAGLNVIALNTGNVYTSQLAQALRNLQVGRHGFRMTVAMMTEAMEGPGGSITDLATLLGIAAPAAQVVYDAMRAFQGKIDTNAATTGLSDTWDKVNRVLGISL